jgi:hypothetical protein
MQNITKKWLGFVAPFGPSSFGPHQSSLPYKNQGALGATCQENKPRRKQDEKGCLKLLPRSYQCFGALRKYQRLVGKDIKPGCGSLDKLTKTFAVLSMLKAGVMELSLTISTLLFLNFLN